jgi:hypothetical protein
MATEETPLQRLTDSARAEHAFIRAEDEVYYFHDYHPGRGRDGGPGNQLILDLKTDVDAARSVAWHRRRKRLATAACADLLKAAWPVTWGKDSYAAPVPPSQLRGDPSFDARLPRILNQAGLRWTDCVTQIHPLQRTHASEVRPDIATLVDAYGVDELFAPAAPKRLIVVDDVLTAGRHFRAMDQVLRATFPDTEIIGLFLARRVEAGPTPGPGPEPAKAPPAE